MPKVSDEHRQQRREQILLASMQCVAEEGFHKTTMADVIRASGLSAGAVYSYFRSKDELILAIADRALGYMDQAITELLERDPIPSPVEVVHYMTSMLVERATSLPVDLTRVAVAAWAEAVRDEQVRAAVASRIELVRGKYAEIVRAQQAAGHIDPQADPTVVAKSLFGVMPGFVLQRLVTQDVTPDDYAAGYAALRPNP
ncbi:TetR/AcrR family transcriptional regulator [Ornithinimicrobium sp. F0845]|uniref:TetR/AcrR family transcriptional regulator n=1 Tax=Ornithinimicrobium sp. F0845 TaxID=2926412 RepID=UPI001FF2C453|nr:TetR/AcrR family transcriptional regulator [Ornithinimicrobium sp. F0845]MCK0111735.1 TetR/AcrR family transcriptional regulator [Ornithinimicrobium sp. F0845]